MSFEQGLVLAVLAGSLILFVHRRWRYDVVALLALLTLVVAGTVPADTAFASFGNPAVVAVAAVLVISKALQSAGFVDLLVACFSRGSQASTMQAGRLTGLGALLSGFINNVAAMALLMPVAVGIARRTGRSPSMFLMPLAFATLLGGLITLIGTPPNIIIASFSGRAGAEPFRMFDFAPVGIGVAAAGVLYLALLGWRLVPKRESQASSDELFNIDDYMAEVEVPPESKYVGRTVYDLEGYGTQDADIETPTVVAIVRGERRIPAPPAHEVLQAGDILVIEVSPTGIERLVGSAGLKLAVKSSPARAEPSNGSEARERIAEAVVGYDSSLRGRTASEMDLRWRHGVNVIAIARQGRRLTDRLSQVRLLAGDILLLQGSRKAVDVALPELALLPLADRELRLGRPRRLFLASSLFIAGVVAAAVGAVPVQVALACAAVGMVVGRVISLREAYSGIDWPIVILIGAMIPVGLAMESTGATDLLVGRLLAVTSAVPPQGLVVLVLLISMLVSNVINNAAAAVVMAPLAVNLAGALDARLEPFLMAVAVGASTPFLTPIGHQSSTLAWEPGGYRFSDYWKVGLPLTVIVVVVAAPLILTVWPL